jgi:hypothetical protein
MAQLMFMKCLVQLQDEAAVVTKTRTFLPTTGMSHDISPVKTGDPIKCWDLINKDLVCRSLQIVQSSSHHKKVAFPSAKKVVVIDKLVVAFELVENHNYGKSHFFNGTTHYK